MEILPKAGLLRFVDDRPSNRPTSRGFCLVRTESEIDRRVVTHVHALD